MEHDEEVTLGGVRFRVERVSAEHKKIVPVDDPLWLLRHITPEPEEKHG